MAIGILGGISAGLSIYQGVSKIFGGKDTQDYGAQQQQLAQTQAMDSYLLGQEMSAVEAESARLMSEAMQGQAAGLYWAAQQAAEAAEKNAERIVKEGGEVVRKKGLEHRQTEGMAKARQAASGIDITKGSAKAFRKELGKENVLERTNIKEAYASQAEVARQQGQVQVAELHAAAGGALAGAQSVLLDAQNSAMLRDFEGQQAISQASLVGQENKASGSSSIFSGIGNIASGIGGLAGGVNFGGLFSSSPSSGGGIGFPSGGIGSF